MDTNQCMHLFFVQSPISYLISEAIIKKENIDSDDCCFLYWRIDSGIISHKSAEIPSYFHSKVEATSLFEKVAYFMWSRRVRSHIESICGAKNYRVYVNKMNHGFLGPISNHSKCIEINLYEEGLAAFWRSPGGCEIERTYLGMPKRITPPFWVRNKALPAGAPYTLDYDRAFSSGGLSMLNFPRCTVVDIASVFQSKSEIFDFSKVGQYAQIYALPLFHEFERNPIFRDMLIKSISNFLKEDSDRQHFLTMHPDNSVNTEFWNEVLQKAGLPGGINDPHVISGLCLEVLATAREDVTIFFVVSSLAAYEPILNARLYSYAKVVFGDAHWKTKVLQSIGFESFKYLD